MKKITLLAITLISSNFIYAGGGLSCENPNAKKKGEFPNYITNILKEAGPSSPFGNSVLNHYQTYWPHDDHGLTGLEFALEMFKCSSVYSFFMVAQNEFLKARDVYLNAVCNEKDELQALQDEMNCKKESLDLSTKNLTEFKVTKFGKYAAELVKQIIDRKIEQLMREGNVFNL
jgi:hypothetical protein